MRVGWPVGMILCGVLAVGCEKPALTAPPPQSVEPGIPSRAQPRLPTLKLWLGAQELLAEVARTPAQVQTGMMFRTNIAENEGMLFVFAYPHRASFWMKNVPIPLSCAYIAPGGEILEIHNMHPQRTNEIVAKHDNIQFVLETSRGWFERNKVATGMVVRTEAGSLTETFFSRR